LAPNTQSEGIEFGVSSAIPPTFTPWSPCCSLEEFLSSDALANLDVAVFFAEIQNLCQPWVVGSFELFYESYSCGLHPDFKVSVNTEDLVEAALFSSVLLKNSPFLNKVNQPSHLKLCHSKQLKGICRLQGNSQAPPLKEFP
jgi:hypothetical protein